MSSQVVKIWSRRGPLAWLLFPLSLLFGLIALLRRLLYRIGLFPTNAFPVPIVVIGNITVGGSGKTPLTIAMIEFLRHAGFKPGVVSRGHGGSWGGTNWTAAQADSEDARRYGDEAVLIARKTRAPVFVGKSRVDAAHRLLKIYKKCDVIICDDGLQHYGLKRDLEIVVFDDRGVWNGFLLPAGPLREMPSRVEKVDAVVVNGERNANLKLPESVPTFRMQLKPGAAYRLTDPADQRALSTFQAQRLLAAAGIGNPRRFFKMLRTFGLEFAEMALPDHFPFRENPFTETKAEAILITEKDAVKCSAMGDPRVWVVPVKADIEGDFSELIVHKIRLIQSKLQKLPQGKNS